jgi:proliferating cell nuclear antigen
MFEVELKNEGKKETAGSDALNLIKAVMESLSEFSEKAEFVMDEHGIKIQVMDTMHVALADVFLSCDMFQHYRCDRRRQIGIDFKQFMKALRKITLERDGVLRIVCDDYIDGFMLQRIYYPEEHDLKLTVKQSSFGSESYRIPEAQYANEVLMPVENFMRIARDVCSFGDTVSIKAEKDSVLFELKSDSIDAAMVLREAAKEGDTKINVTSPMPVQMATKYISYISKAAPMCDRVKLFLDPEMPVFFGLDFRGATYVKFYIAPKLGED